MFSSDRDLLAWEPNLFRDVLWVGQRLVKGTAGVAGSTLTFTSADVTLDAAGVDAGSVVSVAGVSYEVVARLSGTQATISRLRVDSDAAVLPPSPVASAEAIIATFAPQRRLVHDQLLRMLGIEPSSTDAEPSESSIINPDALRPLECLGTLHLVYASASAGDMGSALGTRAEMYRARFAAERQRAAAILDLDADGMADATRRFNLIQFVRG